MLKIFYGPNFFAKRLELSKLRSEFQAKHGDYSIRELTAQDISVDSFKQDLMSTGLFSSSEMIIVKRAEENMAVIESALAAPSSEAKLIILLIDTLDKRTIQYKDIVKHTGFTDFPAMPEAALKGWISSTAKKLGFELSSKLTQEVALRCSGDQQEAWVCLNQLALLQNEKIEASDLDTFLAPSASESAFNLLESALKQDYKKLDSTLKELELFREDPYQIIGLLCSQVHSLAAVSLGSSSGKIPQTIASEIGIHPFAASQQARLARSLNLTKVKLTKLVETFRWLDLSLKTVNKTEPWPMVNAALYQAAAVL